VPVAEGVPEPLCVNVGVLLELAVPLLLGLTVPLLLCDCEAVLVPDAVWV
jgi:hypothetical protein